MPRVNIPIVGLVDFPASMSEEEINQAAGKLYAETQPPGSRGWREQRRAEGLDVGQQEGPSVPGSPRWVARQRSQGLDVGAGNVPPPLEPVGGRGGPQAALRGAMRTGASLVHGAEAVDKSGVFRPPGLDPYGRDTPLTTGETIGEFAGGMAPFVALPPQLWGSPAMAASTGGAMSMLLGRKPGEHVQTQDPMNVLKGAGLSAAGQQAGHYVGKGLTAAGPSVKSGLHRAWRALSGGVDDATEAVMKRAEALGFRRTRGQLPGTPDHIKVREAGLARSPFSMESYAKVARHNQTRGNEIAAESIGLKTPRVMGAQKPVQALPPERLGEAHGGISRKYTQALKGERVASDPKFTSDVALNKVAANDYLGFKAPKPRKAPRPGRAPRPTARLNQYNKLHDEVVQAARKRNGMTGEKYNSLRSRLGDEVRKAYSKKDPDRDLAEAYRGLQDALDDLALRRLPQDKAAILREARGHYRWAVELERPGVTNVNGDVSLPTLSNNLARTSKFYRRALGPPSDLEVAARFAAANKPITGTSGSAENVSVYAPLLSGGMGAMTGAMMPADTMQQRLSNMAIFGGAGMLAPKLLGIPGGMLSQTAGQRLGQFSQNIPGMLSNVGGGAPLVMTPEAREEYLGAPF